MPDKMQNNPAEFSAATTTRLTTYITAITKPSVGKVVPQEAISLLFQYIDTGILPPSATSSTVTKILKKHTDPPSLENNNTPSDPPLTPNNPSSKSTDSSQGRKRSRPLSAPVPPVSDVAQDSEHSLKFGYTNAFLRDLRAVLCCSAALARLAARSSHTRVLALSLLCALCARESACREWMSSDERIDARSDVWGEVHGDGSVEVEGVDVWAVEAVEDDEAEHAPTPLTSPANATNGISTSKGNTATPHAPSNNRKRGLPADEPPIMGGMGTAEQSGAAPKRGRGATPRVDGSTPPPLGDAPTPGGTTAETDATVAAAATTAAVAEDEDDYARLRALLRVKQRGKKTAASTATPGGATPRAAAPQQPTTLSSPSPTSTTAAALPAASPSPADSASLPMTRLGLLLALTAAVALPAGDARLPPLPQSIAADSSLAPIAYLRALQPWPLATRRSIARALDAARATTGSWVCPYDAPGTGTGVGTVPPPPAPACTLLLPPPLQAANVLAARGLLLILALADTVAAAQRQWVALAAATGTAPLAAVAAAMGPDAPTVERLYARLSEFEEAVLRARLKQARLAVRAALSTLLELEASLPRLTHAAATLATMAGTARAAHLSTDSSQSMSPVGQITDQAPMRDEVMVAFLAAVEAIGGAATEVLSDLAIARDLFEKQPRKGDSVADDKARRQVVAVHDMMLRAKNIHADIDMLLEQVRQAETKQEKKKRSEHLFAAESVLRNLEEIGVAIDDVDIGAEDFSEAAPKVRRDEWMEDDEAEEPSMELVFARQANQDPYVSTFGTNWTREGEVVRTHTTTTHGLDLTSQPNIGVFINPSLVGEMRSTFAWAWQEKRQKSSNIQHPLTLTSIAIQKTSPLEEDAVTIWEDEEGEEEGFMHSP